ncbi:hypothetical protein A9W96_29190 [Mycobacterium sp. 1245852.3]|nr:hypothetical protein A9W96_29190 [Mycobacterium sp. 1245852.3]
MQIDISAARAVGLATSDSTGLAAGTAVGAPSTAVGYASDLLDIEVDLVTGAPGNDFARLAVAGAVRINESATLKSQLGEVAGYGASADCNALIVELEGDSRC